MKSKPGSKLSKRRGEFLENIDYYFEDGLMILTAHFLLERGFCCHNDCRNCPYKMEKAGDYNKNVSNS